MQSESAGLELLGWQLQQMLCEVLLLGAGLRGRAENELCTEQFCCSFYFCSWNLGCK